MNLDHDTLAALDWPVVVEALAEGARTAMGKAANVVNCVSYYCVVEYNLIMTTKKYCYSTCSFSHAN